jgi:hypothetical protein
VAGARPRWAPEPHDDPIGVVARNHFKSRFVVQPGHGRFSSGDRQVRARQFLHRQIDRSAGQPGRRLFRARDGAIRLRGLFGCVGDGKGAHEPSLAAALFSGQARIMLLAS